MRNLGKDSWNTLKYTITLPNHKQWTLPVTLPEFTHMEKAVTEKPGLALTADAWGCLVSTPDEAREAARLGAGWLVASHAGLLSAGCTASVMGLLPFADANGMVLDMATDVIRAANGTPVLAGILAIDQFRQGDHLLLMIAESGYVGIQTFPSVGILEGGFRHLLENAELGRQMELDTLGRAGAKGLTASGVAFRPGEAGEAARAGADLVLAHLPLAESGGQREWGAEGLAFLATARAEVGDRAEVAAFVPDTGGRSRIPAGNHCQYENIACAKANL